MSPRKHSRPLRIAFCHPDLGLGGAERLIVDAAKELAARGHMVEISTAYYDPARSFEETRSGAFAIKVRGGWFPRSLGGRAIALCAYIRCLIMAVSLSWSCWRAASRPDVVIVDQVSVAIPLLRWLLRRPVLFYCHFPDLLLAAPTTRLHRFYRAPLDWLEQATTGTADLVVVNSRFTQGIFARTFRRLHGRGLVPDVLYPAVVVPSDAQLAAARAGWKRTLPPDLARFIESRDAVFLSINRFERKKNVGLAIRALAAAQAQASHQGASAANPLLGLVIAGGHDARLRENVEHLAELRALAAELGVAGAVAFLPSFTDAQRAALLASARAVLYTPTDEHLGIVPLEAAAAGRAVLACASGGPLETVVKSETGLLRDPRPEVWADALRALCVPGAAERMGAAARRRAALRFSRAAFGERLEGLVARLAAHRAQRAGAGGGGAKTE
ncbi:ALG2 [Auxenochlorella protothecoides x Auxenochlorella symbiontica]